MRVVIVLVSLLATGEAVAESWWQFLGPDGNGHTASTGLPTNWTDHENVVWKTAVHDRGWSSPVIAGNQIWITTATADGHRLFAVCVDKDSGKVAHDLHIFDVENPQKIRDANTYATPTPVVKRGLSGQTAGETSSGNKGTNTAGLLSDQDEALILPLPTPTSHTRGDGGHD